MAKLFLKNIKIGAKVKITETASVLDIWGIMGYWPSKDKDIIFEVVDNSDWTSYMLFNTEDEKIYTTNKWNIDIVPLAQR